MVNEGASCDPEPEAIGSFAEDGWLNELVATPCNMVVAAGIKAWSIKPGAVALDIFGIGTEDGRLLIFLCYEH